MDWSDFMNNLAQSTIESGVNAAYQFALSSGTYNKQKKLLQKQADLQNQFYGMQNARQDYLLANADLIRKRALDRAGYSTADPQGTGTTPANAMQVPSVSTPGFSMPSINASSVRDMQAGSLLSSQAALANSQSKLASSQASYYERLANKTTSEDERIKLEIQKFKDTYDLQVAQVKANFDQTVSQTHLNNQQKETLIEQANKLAAEVDNITIDTKFNKATFDARKDEILANVRKLAAEGKYEEVRSKLAEHGIIAGLNMFGQIAALSLSGNASDTFAQVKGFILDLFKGVPDFLSQIVSSFVDGFSPDTGGLKKIGPQILDRFPFLKHFFKPIEE